VAQAVAYFAGFETGDASELNAIGTGASVQSSIVRTGGYAFACGTTATQITSATFFTATQMAVRLYLYMVTAPSGGFINLFIEKGAVNRCSVALTTSATLQVRDTSATMGLSTTTGNTVLTPNQWHLIDFVFDLAAGGIVGVWLDGVSEISTTHTSDVTASPTKQAFLVNMASSGAVLYVDDLRIDTGGVTPIGAGACLARQGKAGTPTYDAWTKSGQATAALCWSETPFGIANNCSSSTSGAAQTMLVAPFSLGNATINACKTAVIAKRGVATSPSIRRRIGGSDTDTLVTLTAADKYFDDGIWTTTSANLDTAEIGMVKAANTSLTTVEDAWLIVDYTPGAQFSSVDGPRAHKAQRQHDKIVAWWRQYEELLARQQAVAEAQKRAKAERKPVSAPSARPAVANAHAAILAAQIAKSEADIEAAQERAQAALKAARAALVKAERALIDIEEENAAIVLLLA